MKTGYTVIEIRNNIDLKREHKIFATFDILAQLDGTKKWISIHYDTFFTWALLDSESLQRYIDGKNFPSWKEVIIDLTELDYDWNKQMERYMDSYYSKKLFLVLPEYNADNLNPFISFDGDDDDDEQ